MTPPPRPISARPISPHLTSPRLISDADIASGLGYLARVDADMEAAIARVSTPELRRETPGFPALLRIIVSQQVSLASAAAIWSRIESAVPLTPAAIQALGGDRLRDLGLSRPKTRYILALAEAVLAGRFDPADLSAMDDHEATRAITALTGFGRWSAEIYLMFCLGRPDIWPAGDVALRESVRVLKGLPARPDPDETDRISQCWQPWRSVAAHLLWRYYREVVKNGADEPRDGFR